MPATRAPKGQAPALSLDLRMQAISMTPCSLGSSRLQGAGREAKVPVGRTCCGNSLPAPCGRRSRLPPGPAASPSTALPETQDPFAMSTIGAHPLGAPPNEFGKMFSPGLILGYICSQNLLLGFSRTQSLGQASDAPTLPRHCPLPAGRLLPRLPMGRVPPEAPSQHTSRAHRIPVPAAGIRQAHYGAFHIIQVFDIPNDVPAAPEPSSLEMPTGPEIRGCTVHAK